MSPCVLQSAPLRSAAWMAPVLLCLLGAGLGARPTAAAPDWTGAERTYLRTRDAGALLRVLEPHAATLPAGMLDLARWASGLESSVEGETGSGAVAQLARVVGALRRADLPAARKALEAEDATRAVALAWTEALLRLRLGDDDAAVSRLLAPPLFEWQRDAFLLALVGAALPTDDRRLLAAGARGALERAAARSRATAVESVALALGALLPAEGRSACAFAVRVFRRSGQPTEAARVLEAARQIGIASRDAGIALETALCAWEEGDGADVPRLLGAAEPPAGARAAFLALRHAGRRARLVPLPAHSGHVRGEPKYVVLLAQLATALGRRTTTADVQQWAEAHDTKPSHAAAAASFLRAQGFEVLSVVGDAGAGDALLAAGLPFLLFRVLREESDYREIPVLVRGYDRRTGLWLLEEPDGNRVDIVPHAEMAKARFVCAVPAERTGLLAPFRETPAARAGARIEALLDAVDRGAFEKAVSLLPAASGSSAGEQLYRAYVLHEAANHTRQHAWLVASREAVEHSRRTPPLLGFEAYVRAQALSVSGETEAALEVFDNVVRLEGESATVEMARFAALDVAGNQAAALAAVTAAQRLAPLDSRILFYRASVRGRGGDLAGARNDLRRALERQPDGLRIALALARLEVMDKRPEAALEVLRETERRNPGAGDDPALRLERRAAELAMLEAATTLEELSRARRSEEPETRRRLAYELAQREEDGADAEALLRMLLADSEPDVRVSTLRIYLRPWLQAWVEKESSLARRIANLLADDPEPSVRRAAATLFGRVKGKIASRALAAGLAGEAADKDASVRRASALALATHPMGKPVRTALVAALEDPEVKVRQAAIDVLFQATATTHGYEAEQDEAARAAALEKWRAWQDE
jgi:hypothetical protein